MAFTPQNMVILESVDSTNNYAMALIREGNAGGINAVFAMEQTRGKGRRDREWKSNSGENILVSIPLQMQWLPVSRQFELSVAVALAGHDLLSAYLPGRVFIKWPNDLFIDDRKTGGILIENVIKGTLWQWAVLGIGININQEAFGALGPKATSLKAATGETYDVLALAGNLCSLIMTRMEDIKAGKFEWMLAGYNACLFARDSEVKLKQQHRIFETRITGVSAKGELITRDTTERRFRFDEVDFMGLF
jgi:BirA family biotin operon repressor/biotin-[acetyl-CoA-carboxylase] ligase